MVYRNKRMIKVLIKVMETSNSTCGKQFCRRECYSQKIAVVAKSLFQFHGIKLFLID